MDKIKIIGARENNLKNINLEIPKNSLIVFTGLSGSGKSTILKELGFDPNMKLYDNNLDLIDNFSSPQNAEKFLQKLEEVGIKMAVGTSNSQYLAESVLRSNGVFDKFEVIISGSEEIKGKPFPDIFLAAAKNLGVAPKNCLVIEDVLIGVQAAKNAGMDVFAISDEHSKRDRDEIIRFADFFAEDYQEIITKLF